MFRLSLPDGAFRGGVSRTCLPKTVKLCTDRSYHAFLLISSLLPVATLQSLAVLFIGYVMAKAPLRWYSACFSMPFDCSSTPRSTGGGIMENVLERRRFFTRDRRNIIGGTSTRPFLQHICGMLISASNRKAPQNAHCRSASKKEPQSCTSVSAKVDQSSAFCIRPAAPMHLPWCPFHFRLRRAVTSPARATQAPHTGFEAAARRAFAVALPLALRPCTAATRSGVRRVPVARRALRPCTAATRSCVRQIPVSRRAFAMALPLALRLCTAAFLACAVILLQLPR